MGHLALRVPLDPSIPEHLPTWFLTWLLRLYVAAPTADGPHDLDDLRGRERNEVMPDVVDPLEEAARASPGGECHSASACRSAETYCINTNRSNSPIPIRPFHEAAFPGDEFAIKRPLESKGRTIGKLQALCVATGTVKGFAEAEFLCAGTFTFPGKGTLTAQAIDKDGRTEGAITGGTGTGTYAGAIGSILSRPTKGGASTTATLLE